MTPLYVTIGGVQRELTGIPTMIGGVQRELDSLSATVGGVSRDIFSASNLPPKGLALDAYTWEEIRAISDAGKAAEYFSVGDTKNIVINGTIGKTTFSNLSIAAYIIGIDHNSSQEGENKIHFEIGKINGIQVVLVDDKNGTSAITTSGYFTMYTARSNAGGWENSDMRKTLLGNTGTPDSPLTNSFLAALPSDLRAVMKPVTKYTDNTGGGTDDADNVTATTDYLFLLSEFEYYGTTTYANTTEQNCQKQYAYYKNTSNSKWHYFHNKTGYQANGFCRSPLRTTSNAFVAVNAQTPSTVIANTSSGIAPAFCV